MHMPSMYDKFKSQPLEYCPGCRLENLCGDCDIRECAQCKKIKYCSLCNEFPCEKLLEFSNDGKPHHAESIDNLISIKDMGKEKWLEMHFSESNRPRNLAPCQVQEAALI
jgi:hypothetical protein